VGGEDRGKPGIRWEFENGKNGKSIDIMLKSGNR